MLPGRTCMAARLIQIYYKHEQRAQCYQFAELFCNEGLTIFFENELIQRFVSRETAEKVGVCSWKLREKFKMYIGRPRELTEEVINSEYEVLSFTRNTERHRMLHAADRWHKGFRPTLEKIVAAIGQKCPGEVKIPIYQNAFAAKTEIYKDYVKNWLGPAMDVMLNDPEINKLVTVDSGYTNLAKKDAADSERLQNLIGMPYYPLAPFILERLFSIYVHNNKIPVTWL